MSRSDRLGAGPLRTDQQPFSSGTGARADVPAVEDLVRVVAVDGPAGTGKSTVARLTAGQLGWRFVDTGATYRAATLAVLRAGADPEDGEACRAVAQVADIELRTSPSTPGVRLDGEDVTEAIRTPPVTAAVSAVSSHPAVRALLVDLQRRAIGVQGAVVEGRDIATVVAPRAAVKVYLDARPEVRAARRAGEGAEGVAGRREIQTALETRDARDNKTNALRPSGGALHLDTSELSIDQVVAALVDLVRTAGLTEATS
ncbi:MAG: cmk [Frankiales bacterium]|nr:cmk [Frankiales bacterium]